MSTYRLTDTTEARRAYRRGWQSAKGGSMTAIERADDRRESPAWYAGYFDFDSGYEKYAAFATTGEGTA